MELPNSGPLMLLPVDRIRSVGNPMREKESPKDGGACLPSPCGDPFGSWGHVCLWLGMVNLG